MRTETMAAAAAGVLAGVAVASGARVVATDLPGPRAEALVGAHGAIPEFRFYELDVGNEDQVTGIFARVLADGWQPNVVLNNAAITGEMLQTQ